MLLMGFLEAKGGIRFFDPLKQSIRESRNFKFADDGQDAVVEAMEVPGLQLEWEDEMILPSNSQST
jgi:hypothetical protein